jgi:sugar phosphate permease
VPVIAPSITPSTPLRERVADLLVDVRLAVAVPTLRSVMIGTAIAAGALQGLGFWATAFYERHSTLDADRAAGIAGGIILVGALGGTLIAGRLVDQLRDRVEGAPMLVAGVSQLIGAAILMFTFLPVPLLVRLPGQAVAVALIVGGLVPLAVMTSEVVPAAIRGAAFSLTTFLAALAGAASPLAIGFVADRFKIPVDGEMKGDLAKGFLAMTPLIFVGALVVLRGRRHVTADMAAAAAATTEALSASAMRRGSEPGGA